jgi:hypothetical protein
MITLMKRLTIFLIIPFVLLFTACSKKQTPLIAYTQDISAYLKELTPLHVNLENFRSRYFMPWRISAIKMDKEKLSWANVVFNKKDKYYAENMLPWEYEKIQKIIENTNFEDLNKVAKYAITTKEVQIRNLPSLSPFFKDPNLAGEGFNFDYLQNTRLHVNEPLFVSHYSLDKTWAFVQTNVSTGWIRANELKLLGAKELTVFHNSPLLLITKDNIPLYDTASNYLLHVKLGSLLPILSEDENFFYTYIFAPHKILTKVSKDEAATFPLAFEENSIKQVANELLGERYGWGGFMNNRDCSAMTKDYFQSFGIWLPRNSFSQSKSGDYISLENLTIKEKEALLKEKAIPFQSLLYLRGHIMLYLGTFEEKALVMHNTWGLKVEENGQEKRKIIGRSIISDLYLGSQEESIIEESMLINQLKGFVIAPLNTYFAAHPLTKSYESVVSVEGNLVYFDDNTTMIYDDKEEKTFEQKLENPDIEDMFELSYKAFEPIMPPQDDAGRVRNEDFFKKLYGANQEEIRNNLVKLTWIDGQTLYFNKRQGASKQLQKIITKLQKLPKEYQRYITNIAGTYNHRTIAGTNRLSAHSFGIAIDLNVKESAYWKWDKKYNFRNNFPQEIVDIFEEHGFIWGGRWYHYDTMHFEYRPELFFSIE